MSGTRSKLRRRILGLVVSTTILVAASAFVNDRKLLADTGACNGASVTLPFTDVASGNVFFCSVAAAYYSGLTNGTSGTTYAPSANVTREQMAAFVSRTLNQSLKRGSRRGALDQWATPTSLSVTGKTAVGTAPRGVRSDGADLWVANVSPVSQTVSRVRASDGKLLETWTNAVDPEDVLVARGRIFVCGRRTPGLLYVIDPKLAPGAVTLLSNTLLGAPSYLAFDGFSIWAGCADGLCKVNPNTGGVTVFADSDLNSRITSLTFDGTYMWAGKSTAFSSDKILKVDLNGNVLQSVTVDKSPLGIVFDGINLWIPNLLSDSITVVRTKDGSGNPLPTAFVVATLTGNGLNGPVGAAYDGERIAVINSGADSISLWRAADLVPLGAITGATDPSGICSDGVNFWIALDGNPGFLARL